jgi:hypothetical protein
MVSDRKPTRDDLAEGRRIGITYDQAAGCWVPIAEAADLGSRIANRIRSAR